MPWMNITCANCGKTADVDNWTTRPVTGELPRNRFQCPSCNWAFERRHGAQKVYPNGFIAPGPVTLVPVGAML